MTSFAQRRRAGPRHRARPGSSVDACVSAHADREAVRPVVGFGPPAVEHREVEPAVEHDLLPAGAGGFQRTPRVVQPDVDALHQVPADVDVVVFDEDDLAGETPGRASAWRSAGATALPGPSCGWALPAKMNWTGRSRVVDESAQSSRGRAGSGWPACRWRTAGRSRWSARRGSSARRSCAIDVRPIRRGARPGSTSRVAGRSRSAAP